MSYPRRQTVIIFAVCIAAVIVVVLYRRNEQTNAAVSDDETVAVVATSSPVISSDGTDWKQAFEQGSASSSSAFGTVSQAVGTASDTPLTSVDRLGQSFLTQYANLRQAGLTDDPSSVNDAMGQVAAQSIADLPSPKTYTLTDVRTVSDAPSAISAYGKDINSVFASDLPSQNEAILAQKALEDNDMSELQNIDPVIKGYQSMLNDLLVIPTPSSLATDHLELLNGVSIALYNAESFRHVDTDPVRGMSAVSMEMVGLQDMSSALTSIRDYFVSAGIAFGS